MNESFIISKQIGKLLLKSGRTIAVAESCTGGFFSASITDVPGSSAYFGYGIVSYSNSAKINILGVNYETLNKFGAVSKEVALEMAAGVRRLASSDFGISITGIAGPGGATPTKPIGLVYVGFNSAHNSNWIKFNFKGSRQEIRAQAVLNALKFLLEQIKKE